MSPQDTKENPSFYSRWRKTFRVLAMVFFLFILFLCYLWFKPSSYLRTYVELYRGISEMQLPEAEKKALFKEVVLTMEVGRTLGSFERKQEPQISAETLPDPLKALEPFIANREKIGSCAINARIHLGPLAQFDRLKSLMSPMTLVGEYEAYMIDSSETMSIPRKTLYVGYEDIKLFYDKPEHQSIKKTLLLEVSCFSMKDFEKAQTRFDEIVASISKSETVSGHVDNATPLIINGITVPPEPDPG